MITERYRCVLAHADDSTQLRLRQNQAGVLEATDGGSQRLPAPVRGDDATTSGDGWTFKAAPGWVIREGSRRGDYEVVRHQP
jgi:hypothetical protein